MSNVVSIASECIDLFSIALYHNRINLFKTVCVKNVSDFNLKNIEIIITSSPEFFNVYSKRIGEISARRCVVLDDIELNIDSTRLSYLSAPTTSNVTITIKSQGEILDQQLEQVQLLPYDYVPSLNSYPELVSAFVTPMQEEIIKISNTVYKYIDSPEIKANIDTWSNLNRENSYAIIKAIYEAVKDLKITYNLSPIYFENKNSKIKLSESILSTKSANGFEMSLLFASLCECLGFNPFVLYQSGKAFVGAFFTNKTFGAPIVDDSRPMLSLNDGICNDYCILDPTTFVNGINISFEDSAKMAHKFVDESEMSVIIDVAECRKAGISPIFNRVSKDGNVFFEEIKSTKKVLNFKFPENVNALANQVKEYFTKNKSYSSLIFANEKNMVFMIGTGNNIIAKFVFNTSVSLKNFSFSGLSELIDKDVISNLVKINLSADNSDVSNSITTLYEKASFEKKMIGLIDLDKANESLFLALGLIKGETGRHKICAPLVLIPCNIDYDKASSSFQLYVTKSSAIFNSAIFDYLKNELDYDLINQIENLSPIDDYANAFEIVKEQLKPINFELFDVGFITKAKFENYIISTYSNSEHLSQCTLLNDFFEKNRFSSDLSEIDRDALQDDFFELPMFLDESQGKAYTIAKKHNYTIIEGPRGSGKTRVAAAIAQNYLINGKKVLYSSNSNGDINKFLSYAKDMNFDDFVFSVSKNNYQKNSFKFSHVSESLDVCQNTKEQILSTHKYLSNYYYALHKVRDIGFSLHEAISQYERYKTFPYAVNFTNADILKLSKEDVFRWFDIISSLTKAGADCREPYNNPLMYVKCENFSYELKSSAASLLSRYKSVAHKYIREQNKLSDFLGIEPPIIRIAQTNSIIKLVKLLLDNIDYIYPQSLNRTEVDAELLTLESYLETCDDFFDTQKFIKDNFSQDVLNFDIEVLIQDWRNACLKFAIAKATGQSSVKSKLKMFALDPKFITTENTLDCLVKISAYKRALGETSKISTITKSIFGIDLNVEIQKNNCEIFDKLRKSLEITKIYKNLLYDIYGLDEKPDTVFSHNDALFANREKFIKELKELSDGFIELDIELRNVEKSLEEVLELDLESAKTDNEKIWYYYIEKFIDRMIDNVDILKHWCTWNVQKKVALENGLSGVINLYANEQMTYNDIKNAFLKGFFKSVSEYLLSCEPEINNFSKESFEALQLSLVEYSRNWHKCVKRDTHKTICEAIGEDAFSETNQMLLTKEFCLNDNFYNVNIENKKLLLKAKPCLVSKGLSVLSQIGTCEKFDVLIIDTVDDFAFEKLVLLLPLAEKVILLSEKAKNNLFLEKLLGLNIPRVTLSWIYNYNFVANLVNKMFYPESTSYIFPDSTRVGIRIARQKGTYDRKNTRTNFIEASAVVDEIMKKVDNVDESFSVITMTDEQASLVELLLTKRLQSLSDSQRQSFFSRPAPFHISSINNCSFVPSDTVIFSTTFAVEEKPKYKDTISRYIPELTKDDTVQRLINSLLCAKGELVLVTSLSEETLNGFKTVIPNYCTFKSIVLNLFDNNEYSINSEMNKNSHVENSIVRQVINKVESLGFQADVDVGINSCRIDVAVRRKNEDGYLFGVIFDESAYLYGGDLINRILIQNNLENTLGWKIIRIYTVEWFENSPKQLELITDLLTEDKVDNPIISFNNF